MEGIELGSEVEDIVTGFRGIATARVRYLNGCIQYCVKPKIDKDGKKIDGEYIDLEQLKVIGAGITVKMKDIGGPADDTPGSSYGG